MKTIAKVKINFYTILFLFSILPFFTVFAQQGKIVTKDTSEIGLNKDRQHLTEFIDIGYGTSIKSNIEGSISSVDIEEIQKLPDLGIGNMLQGMAAGVQVFQNTAQPGSLPEIRIRGSENNPLIVINGIPGGSLNDINPADVKSIEILKDAASQSIYGAAGRNGVILINTKKGNIGKHQIKFDMYIGSQHPWKKEMNISDSRQFAEIYNLSKTSVGGLPYFPTDPNTGLYLDPTDSSVLINTKWNDEIFRKNALVENINLSLSGGNKISRFYFGLGYKDEKGSLNKTTNRRYTVSINSDHKIFKNLTIGENLNLSDVNQAVQEEDYNSPLSTSVQMLPIVPIYAQDGSGNFEYMAAGLSSNVSNPVSQITYNNNEYHSTTLSGNAFIRIKIIKGISFESNLGAGFNPAEYRAFLPTFEMGSVGFTNPAQSKTTNDYHLNDHISGRYLWQNVINYNFQIADKHNFGLTLGNESGHSKYSNTYRIGIYDTLPFEESEWKDFSSEELMTIIYQDTNEINNKSYFFRLNYDFAGIFLLQAIYRQDKYSGAYDAKGKFPSISAGIKFSEFNFIKNLNILDLGKIRIGYANSNNKDSDWQAVLEKNAGIDLVFSHSHFAFSFDFYDRIVQPFTIVSSTSDTKGFEINLNYDNQIGKLKYDIYANFTRAKTKITNIGDPLYAGNSYGLANVCQTHNDGPISAFYGYKTNGIYKEEDFVWYKTSTNITGKWNRIPVDPNGRTIVSGFDENNNPVTYNTMDESALPGDPKFVDTDGDHIITSHDMVQIGDPNPDFTYGFGVNLEYSGFDLSMLFQGSYGNDIFNVLKASSYTVNNGGLNLAYDLKNSFIPAIYNTNDRNVYPEIITPAQNTNSGVYRMDPDLSQSDFYIEDGSYLRLKNIQLGYTLPATISRKIKAGKLRIYINTMNLFTFTKYTGFDPEVDLSSSLQKGFDRGTYPQSKMYSVGINLIF